MNLGSFQTRERLYCGGIRKKKFDCKSIKRPRDKKFHKSRRKCTGLASPTRTRLRFFSILMQLGREKM